MIKMTFKEYKEVCPDKYQAPAISVIDVQVEGVLCESNESLEEYPGEW